MEAETEMLPQPLEARAPLAVTGSWRRQGGAPSRSCRDRRPADSSIADFPLQICEKTNVSCLKSPALGYTVGQPREAEMPASQKSRLLEEGAQSERAREPFS